MITKESGRRAQTTDSVGRRFVTWQAWRIIEQPTGLATLLDRLLCRPTTVRRLVHPALTLGACRPTVTQAAQALGLRNVNTVYERAARVLSVFEGADLVGELVAN